MTNAQMTKRGVGGRAIFEAPALIWSLVIRIWSLIRHSGFGIRIAVLALLAGCAKPQPYGQERQLTLNNGTHPCWAIAPAINLSGETSVDPILQADLLYHQLAAVNNVRLIPVNQVVQVYAAMRISKVESEEQANIVCEQLGCDGLIIPTISIYDPYNPPKLSVALSLMRRAVVDRSNNVDVRELTRAAAPQINQPLPANPGFIQVTGMYDAQNGSVRDALHRYATGRNDPTGPLAEKEYYVCMDRYCEFVYYTLIEQMIGHLPGEKPQQQIPAPTAQNGLTAQAG